MIQHLLILSIDHLLYSVRTTVNYFAFYNIQ